MKIPTTQLKKPTPSPGNTSTVCFHGPGWNITSSDYWYDSSQFINPCYKLYGLTPEPFVFCWLEQAVDMVITRIQDGRLPKGINTGPLELPLSWHRMRGGKSSFEACR